MPRVVSADVQAITGTTLDYTPFIMAATLVIDRTLSTAGYSLALLTEIERWLAAHFAAARDPLVSRRQLGDSAISYERGKLGDGLLSTPYGQQVALLDSSGLLAETVGGRVAQFEVF